MFIISLLLFVILILLYHYNKKSKVIRSFLLFFIIAFGAFIFSHIVYQFQSMERREYNSAAQVSLRNLISLIESFYSDYEKYPHSIPLTTGEVLLSDDEHETSFSTGKGVYLIFKSNGDNYSIITTHLSGDELYAYANNNNRIQGRNIGIWNYFFQSKDGRLSDIYSHCPVPGQTNWEGW